MSTGGWIFSVLGTIFIVALLVAAVTWIASDRRSPPESSTLSAGEILDRRLASGEITPEQYNELHETLGVSTLTPRDRDGQTPVGTAG